MYDERRISVHSNLSSLCYAVQVYKLTESRFVDVPVRAERINVFFRKETVNSLIKE